MTVEGKIGLAILLSLVLAIAGALLGLWATRKKMPGTAALGIGIGLVAGLTGAQWAVSGWPPFPPTDVTQGLPFLGLLALAAGIVQAASSRWGIWAAAGASALSLGFLLRPKIAHTWTLSETLLWSVLCLAATLWVWHQLTGPGRESGPALPLILAILATATSLSLVLGHSALLAQLGGAVAAGMGVLMVFSLFQRSPGLTSGGVGVVTIFFAALLICGYFYASLPGGSAILLALSLLITSTRLPGLKAVSGWKLWLLRGLLVTVLSAIAVYQAYNLNAGIEDYYEY